MASQGVGTISHLEGEMFNTMAQIEMAHVPYKGSQPALLDLMGGRVQVLFDSIAAALPHIRAGKVRALAVTAIKRSPVLPELPTIAEAGLNDYRADSWLGILVPAATPAPIVARLNDEIARTVNDPEMHKRLIASGFAPQASTPEQFAARIRSEIVHWAKLVKATGASAD